MQTWANSLKEARRQKESSAGGNLLVEPTKIAEWNRHLLTYVAEFSRPKIEGQEVTGDQKELIKETRAALRLGLLILSAEAEGARRRAQEIAVVHYCWHVPLIQILSLPRGDSKCRLLGAQLLSNLITSNATTARMLCSNLPLSPSPGSISSAMMNSLVGGDSASGFSSINTTQSANWVEMILSCSKNGNREAVAAILAALNNCIVALSQPQDMDELPAQVAESSLLISTILRQFVSVNAVKTSTLGVIEPVNENEENEHWDDVSDWAYLVLTKLAQLGYFPKMYQCIGSTGGSAITQVLPEQNVLLHCIVRRAEEFTSDFLKNPSAIGPLGVSHNKETTEVSYQFLAAKFQELAGSYYSQGHEATDTLDVADQQLVESAIESILDVFAAVLGVDSTDTGILRSFLGRSTSLLQESALLLGRMVDKLSERSTGTKSRDLRVNVEEQRLLVSLVRVQGNLCYGCRENQDLMRCTLVPVSIKTARDESAKSEEKRNALHVLMSCTAYSTSCFTLREWSVIAIRNVLDDNLLNQNIVAELDAQSPVQSADLAQVGIRVQMDGKGKVKLETLKEDDELKQVTGKIEEL